MRLRRGEASIAIGSTVFGFMWACRWRAEWKRRFEYWYRSQFGPFYILHPRGDQ